MTFLTLNTSSGPIRLRSLLKGAAIADNAALVADTLPLLGNDFFSTPDVYPKPLFETRAPTGGTITSWRRPNGMLAALRTDDTGLLINMHTKDPVYTFISKTPNLGFTQVDAYDALSVIAKVERKMLAYQVRHSIYASNSFGATHEDRVTAFKSGRHAENMAARLVAFALDHSLANFTGALRPTSADDCYLYASQLEGSLGQPFSVKTQNQLMPFCQVEAVNRPTYDPPCVLMVGPGSLRRGCALLASLGRPGGPVRGQASDMMRQFDRPMQVLLVGAGALRNNWPSVQGPQDISRAISEAAYILHFYNHVSVDKMGGWLVALIDNLPVLDAAFMHETPGGSAIGWDPSANHGAGALADFDEAGDAGVAQRVDRRIAELTRDVPGLDRVAAGRLRSVLGGYFDNERENIPCDRLDAMRESVYDNDFARQFARMLSACAIGVAHAQLADGAALNLADAQHNADQNGFFEFAPQLIDPGTYPVHPRSPISWDALAPWAYAIAAGRDTYRIVASTLVPADGWNGPNAPAGVREYVGRPMAGWPILQANHAWVVVLPQCEAVTWNALANVRVMVQTWIGAEYAPTMNAPDSDAIPARWLGRRAPRILDPAADRAGHTAHITANFPDFYRAVQTAHTPGHAVYFSNPNQVEAGLPVNTSNQRVALFLHGASTMWYCMNGEGRTRAARAAYVHSLGRARAPLCPDEYLVHLGGQHGLCDICEPGGLWVLTCAPLTHSETRPYVHSNSFLEWLSDKDTLASALIHRRACKEAAYAHTNIGPASLDGSIPALGMLPAALETLFYDGAIKTRTVPPDAAAMLANGVANNMFPDALGVLLKRVTVAYDCRMRVRDARPATSYEVRWYCAYMRPVLIPRTYHARVLGIYAPTRIGERDVKEWMRCASWATGFYHVDGKELPATGYALSEHDEALITWMQDQPGDAKEVVRWTPRGKNGSYCVELPTAFLDAWDRRIEHQENRFVLPYEQQISAVLTGASSTIRNYRADDDIDTVDTHADIDLLDITHEFITPYNFARTPNVWNVNDPALYGGPPSGAVVRPAVTQSFPYGAQHPIAPMKCFALSRAAIQGLKAVAERGVVELENEKQISNDVLLDQQVHAGTQAKMSTVADTLSELTGDRTLLGNTPGSKLPSGLPSQLKDANTKFKDSNAGGTAPTGDARTEHTGSTTSGDTLAQIAALMAGMTEVDRAAMLALLTKQSPGSGDNKGGTDGAPAASRADF